MRVHIGAIWRIRWNVWRDTAMATAMRSVAGITVASRCESGTHSQEASTLVKIVITSRVELRVG